MGDDRPSGRRSRSRGGARPGRGRRERRAAAFAARVELYELATRTVDLEDVFLRLTGQAPAEDRESDTTGAVA
ncbi:hypothetical protein [Actinotalea soli]|uniref:hypothetical protein n=1 Tax=Actinotalea soli TaxID=2819234 RepID=UPI001FB6BC8C|nr:hypothetical protein [Actinotalea soli]